MHRRGVRRLPERRDGGDRRPPYKGARSLLRWLLVNLAKVNGDFLRANGCGIEKLSASELCDIAYAAITSGIERHYYALVAAGAKWEGTDDPLGDDIRKFEERVGLRDDPNAWALAMHKQMMESQGKEWDDTPVAAGSGQWWDQDVEFSDMSDLDAQAKRREAVSRNRGLFVKDKKG